MNLLRTDMLPVLVAVPLAALLLWALDRARARRLVRLVGPRTPTLAPGLSRRRGRVLFAGALLLALLAVLQPAWGEATRTIERRGADIVICLDVSRSMLARDLEPSRLERARSEIRALAARTKGDRLGLVVFAGEARLAVPLTKDMDSFAELVGLATPLSVSRGGTDLGAALSTAIGRVPDVIVLLTDGEDHERRGLRVAQDAGIPVHCVGYGTALGGKIPVEGGFLKDRAGNEVVSALDPTTLRRIADAAGGAYTDAGLVELYENEIEPIARRSYEAAELRAKENRFQWPLLAAFLLWILDLCVGDRRR